ncbi:uncharacterized protein LOC121943295 [Plectropomus leopardus]|uniref:uncharacterized protein LOC121943295 n=1 Tax=Plectropomus leopardus TaxID=160734 RepID=UPI001C4CECBF|nr:uncharacterized protein LOC121943295 [Plectropomus leopardus]XP_042342737.1 uncharacterized protein LOC121943295 [Plectropomus leopardus]
MYCLFLSVISCLCLLHTGLGAEECSQAVLAERETLHVPAGGSLSLFCVVRHCGRHWEGNWTRSNSTQENLGVRHTLSNVKLSDNETKLILDFVKVSKLDEGSYGCNVKWGKGDNEQGNFKYINVTAAVTFPRSTLHRVLVCASAFLCLPIILGLACCLSSKVKSQPVPRSWSTHHAAVYRDEQCSAPQPPPRCPIQPMPVPQKQSIPSHKATPKSRQKAEVVYADISQDALRQQRATRAPDQSTEYSSLRFS